MRIALVSDWTTPRLGGVERQVDGLAVQLRERGHDVRVITFTPGPPTNDGIRVHRIPSIVPPGWRGLQHAMERFGMHLGDPVPRVVTRMVDDIITRELIDVVHAHSMWSPLTGMAVKLAREHGIASVVTNHSLLEHASLLFFRSYDDVVGWRRWPHVMTAVSRAAARDAELASLRPVRVIPNGIDTTAWAYARTAPAGDPALRAAAGAERRVVAVMRLVGRKAPDTLLRAMVRVRAELDGGAPRLDVYGGGPARASLERHAADLGIGDLVTFHGARSQREIADALALADVFVLPGRREAFGIAAAEALAAGVPVVAMAGSGAADLFEDGTAGLFVPDAVGLGHAIARIVGDDALRMRMAANAPAAVARFDWDHVAPAYLRAYEDALALT